MPESPFPPRRRWHLAVAVAVLVPVLLLVALPAQRGIEPNGVYVAFFNYGSPATRYGLWAGRRIVAVDEIPTPDLKTFVDLVAGKKDRTSVRLKTVTWNGAVEVITLKLDNQYWPAYEIRRSGDGWQRSTIG